MLYSVVLVSSIQQWESAISIHMPPPSWTSLPAPTSPLPHLGCQNPGLSFLCCTATSHGLSILHMVMYIFQCYSLNSFHSLPTPLCPHQFSMSESLFLPWKWVHQYHLCINIWHLFFYFWLTSLCITGSRFIYLTTTDLNWFLSMAE